MNNRQEGGCLFLRRLPSVRYTQIISERLKKRKTDGIITKKQGRDTMDQLMLLKPGRDYAEGIFQYRSAFIMAGDPMDGTGSLYRMPDPEDWLTQVTDLARPETTPEDWVPTTQYICVRPHDNRLVGI